MKFGDTGPKVVSLQRALTAVGFPLVQDGQFGATTQAAVETLQKQAGIVVDGVVGPQTLGAIDKLEAALPKSSPTSPAPVLTGGGLTTGFDCSFYQGGAIDWKAASLKHAFAQIKASEGGTGRDSDFARNWAGARANGMFRSAYHYFKGSQNGMTQAQNLLNQIGQIQSNDLPVMCDLEEMDGSTPTDILGRLKVFMDRIKEVTKKTPMLYCNLDILERLGMPKELGVYPLCYAHPGSTLATVKVPPIWPKCTFLQVSFTGSVEGIPGACDLDVFNGTAAELAAFANQVR